MSMRARDHMPSPSRRKKNSKDNMIENPMTDPSAPRKNEPLLPATCCSTSCPPEITHDRTWLAEIPLCACTQASARAMKENCSRSAKLLMSRSRAAAQTATQLEIQRIQHKRQKRGPAQRAKKRLEYKHQQATQEGGDREGEDAWIKGGFGGHRAIISSPSRAGPSRRAVGRRCPLLKFGRVA